MESDTGHAPIQSSASNVRRTPVCGAACDGGVCRRRASALPECDSYALFFFFFLNDAPPTELSPLPLKAALPIWARPRLLSGRTASAARSCSRSRSRRWRSEEHTSELQSRLHLVCRLLLEKK